MLLIHDFSVKSNGYNELSHILQLLMSHQIFTLQHLVFHKNLI